MKIYVEREEKPVNPELREKISGLVDGIIISPHLFFMYDRSGHVQVYGPEKGNGTFSKKFGRNNHQNASIEIAAPFLLDNEAHAEVLSKLDEPDTCETDIQGKRNFRYDVSPQGLTYLLYVTLWPLEEYHRFLAMRMYVGRKEFDRTLIDRLSRV